MKVVLLLLWLAVLPACIDVSGARRALEAQGYTDIEIITHRWRGFMGTDGDNLRTWFSAVTPSGTKVRGVVRTTFGKGQTIHPD